MNEPLVLSLGVVEYTVISMVMDGARGRLQLHRSSNVNRSKPIVGLETSRPESHSRRSVAVGAYLVHTVLLYEARITY